MMSYLEGDSLLREIEKSIEDDEDQEDYEEAMINYTDTDGEGVINGISSKEPSTAKNKRPSS
jgi:hypothetical protein